MLDVTFFFIFEIKLIFGIVHSEYFHFLAVQSVSDFFFLLDYRK